MKGKKEKSLLIFQAFVDFHDNGEVDVTRMFSRECFDYWLRSRANVPKNPPEAFRKALTSHCSGVDGRRPFEPKVEQALLLELRKKQVWECFRGTCSKVGLRGLQVKGYWEKKNGEFDQAEVHPKKRRARTSARKPKTKKVKAVKMKEEEFVITKPIENYTFKQTPADFVLPFETFWLPQFSRTIDPFEELLLDLKS